MLDWMAETIRPLIGTKVPLRHRLAVLCGTLLAILLFCGASWIEFSDLRAESFAAADTAAHKLLISFEDHASRQIDYADSYLRTTRRLALQPNNGIALKDQLHEIKASHADDFIGMLAMTDKNGRVIFYSENPDTPEVSLADRDYFRQLQNSSEDQLVIDSTRLGRLTGKMQYRLIRPILRDGKFDGIILVTLLPEHITQFYGSLSLGAHSLSVVMTTDRRLIARAPAPQSEAYGRAFPNRPEWEDLGRHPSGKIRVTSAIDGLERCLFYARLPDYPLVVIVGVSDQDVLASLADARTNQLLLVGGFICGALLVCVLLLWLLGELNERRQAANALKRLNRVYRVLSECNQAVLRADSENGVYHAMCEAIVTYGGYRMAWIGLVSSDDIKTVRPVASAGFVQGYLDLANISLQGGQNSHGPAGVAIRTGQPEVNVSFTENPAMGPWRRAALERGYQSSIALPLKSAEGCFGVLNIYAGEQDDFGPEEVKLFVDLAEDLSHGVMGLRLHHDHDVMANALVQAQKMEALGHLTGGIAHDFNNLLQVVLSNLDLVSLDVAARGMFDSPLARFVENAVQGAQQGAKLTGQLLAFARRQPLKPEARRLDLLVEDMVSLLARSLGGNIAIKTECCADLWTALADANQLRNAILNLAINARDAMPDGGTLTITLDNVSLPLDQGELKAGDYVSLAISDSGVGMSAEVLSQAFDPFFTTKPEGAGTGLGLSMVYGFVKQSGGHVRIDSILGWGTSVTLYLPRTLLPEAQSPTPGAKLPHGHGETVLVVEDDDGVRASAITQLTELGYQTLEASSGDMAIELLSGSGKIDLLFTDLVMPGLYNGRDLATRARQLRPDLPVLFTSGYAQDKMLDQEQLDGGRILLGKPYRLAALAEALQTALQAAKTSSSAKARLLLVEDDPLIREVMMETLELAGFPVMAAATADEALALLAQSPGPDLMITDFFLPGMTGLDLAEKARIAHPALRVILATGQAVAVGECERAGVTVLQKPFQARDLMKEISRLMMATS